MRLRETLYIVRRWQLVIVAGVLIGFVVGWISAPGRFAATTAFEATHSLIITSQGGGNAPIFRASVLATRGAVPDRVASRLSIDRRLVRSRVSVEIPLDAAVTGVLLITGRSDDRAQAEALANVTAEEVIAELGGSNSGLRTLEPAVATANETDVPLGPSSRSGRALMLAAFGLLLGAGSAFTLDRFDNRIRSKPAAEDALGVPVVAEVPPIPRDDRGRIVTGGQPSSFLEAYRRLRTSVDRWTETTNGGGVPVVVVTSPTGGEGTTTTVAHLSATLGEIGRSVVVISADLRHPTLHLYFDRALEPGLTDVLRGAPDARHLTDLNLATTVRGVRFVPSGAPVRNPAPLLDHVGDHLRDARSMGDFVLVDAPPLLTTSDGADLAKHADAVLLVVRAGRTSVRAATRSVELLDRLGIPVLGTVLIASDGFQSR